MVIKYNGFQIRRNKPDETPYLILKNKLESTNFMRTTSLKLWKSKTRITSYELRVQIQELRVQIHELEH